MTGALLSVVAIVVVTLVPKPSQRNRKARIERLLYNAEQRKAHHE